MVIWCPGVVFRRFIVAIVLASLLASAVVPGFAAGPQLSLIRDTETEDTIRLYATSVFLAARLDPAAVRIYLVRDNRINAFVAGGQNLFINTGLLVRAGDPGEVIGVIAHETGHIAGGHLARSQEQMSNTTAEAILAMVLGAAAAVAGRPDVGTAVIAGGQDAALRGLLRYSRTQESAADNAALRYLDDTQQSAKGLLDFMTILQGEMRLSPGLQDPYLMTHPLTEERIGVIAEFVAQSPYSKVPVPESLKVRQHRIVGKLRGFLDPPEQTFRRYPASDTSLEARYARAVAHYRQGNVAEAIRQIDQLLAENPNDPYFYEIKGQFLFETGQLDPALAAYRKASAMLPDANLIRVDLARVQIAIGGKENLTDAIGNLRSTLVTEPNRPFVWRQLAIALGQNGDIAESSLAQAEEAMLLGKKKEARYYAERAADGLPRGSASWLKAQDILQSVQQDEQDQR